MNWSKLADEKRAYIDRIKKAPRKLILNILELKKLTEFLMPKNAIPDDKKVDKNKILLNCKSKFSLFCSQMIPIICTYNEKITVLNNTVYVNNLLREVVIFYSSTTLKFVQGLL